MGRLALFERARCHNTGLTPLQINLYKGELIWFNSTVQQQWVRMGW